MKIKATPPDIGNMNFHVLSQKLTEWYQQHQRVLPWRASRDPYRIWISEVMLQQTTIQAVMPYYERFLQKFPDLQSLSVAKIEDVLESWAGLGYYSRARNLHRAAVLLSQVAFPQTHAELLNYPGFGPYTARAVASLAFQEKVGVLDGNVIRVLTRLIDSKMKWWKTEERKFLQNFSDQLNQHEPSDLVNQALMDLGSTVCTPTKPHCFRCPWSADCQANLHQTQTELPLAKPKRSSEIWLWQPQILRQGQKVALLENDYAPFLKGQWLPPGKIEKAKKKPKHYVAQHSITHHQIFILPGSDQVNPQQKSRLKWFPLSDLKKVNPSSLLQKVLEKAIPAVGALLLVFHLMGCGSTKIKPISPPPANPDTPSSDTGIKKESANVAVDKRFPQFDFGERITKVGENFHGRFSPDGLSLIYVSTRGAHANQQIYSWSTTDLKETRRTYSDGDADWPVDVDAENQFAYISNTDSEKEVPRLFCPNRSTAGKDIFLSDQAGSSIRKISHLNTNLSSLQRGSGSDLLYTLNQPGHHELSMISEKGEKEKNLVLSKDAEIVSGLESSKHLLLWLEESSTNGFQLKQRRGSGKTQIVKTPFTSIHDFSWWDESKEQLLISGKINGERIDSIYIFDPNVQCLIPLLSSKTDLWFPSVQQQHSELAVTLIEYGLRQIYIDHLPETLPDCVTAP